jgi:hypothetical protein
MRNEMTRRFATVPTALWLGALGLALAIPAAIPN